MNLLKLDKFALGLIVVGVILAFLGLVFKPLAIIGIGLALVGILIMTF